jgi:hypothetical protein
MNPHSYDDAREADEQQPRGHKRGGYLSQRIAKKVNADVTPDAVKQPVQLGDGVSLIVHYDKKEGFAGKLLGVLILVDGTKTDTIKVWDAELHHQVQDLMNAGNRLVKVETKPSDKWGPSLVRIEEAK